MEREYTARNGMEEFTTRRLGEQERMASRMRETATAVKNPLIYIYIYRGDSRAVVRGGADYNHDTKVKPEAGTAVVELLMMGVRTPETC